MNLDGTVVTNVGNSEQIIVESRVDDKREAAESFCTRTECILHTQITQHYKFSEHK